MRNGIEKIIGIDSGTNTGFAIWDRTTKTFEEIATLKIHQAMFKILFLYQQGAKILVRVEDARKRKWYGDRSKVNLQGVGSVKRDASIMEDFLKDLGIPFEMVHPVKGMTKVDSKRFEAMTGYKGRTSSHSRDAAMMVYQL